MGISLSKYNAMPPRSRAWVFTLNNPVTEPTLLTTGASYITFGRELGLLGTPHLQGYVHFSTVKSLAQVRAAIPGSHLETRKGTISQAIIYCHKDGDVYEEGVRPLDAVDNGLKEKERWAEVWRQAKSGKFRFLYSGDIENYLENQLISTSQT